MNRRDFVRHGAAGLMVPAAVKAGIITQAGPRLSTVAGGGSDGVVIASGDVTITYSTGGFGSKSTAAPLYFSDFESNTVGDTYADAGLERLDGSGGAPSVENDYAHSGTKSLKQVYPASTESFPQVGLTFSPATEIYVASWFRFERTSGTGSPSPILKLSRGGSIENGGYYHGSPRFYDTIRPSGGNAISGRDTGWNTPAAGTSYDPYTLGYGSLNQNFSMATWSFLEWNYRLSTPGGSDGYYYTKVDGTINTGNPLQVRVGAGTVITPYGQTNDSGSAATIDWVICPFDGLSSPGSNAYIGHVDELYIDTSPKRVVMTDSATFASSTKFALQPPTAWADGAITATLNKSNFSTSDTGYFHVFTDVNTSIYVGSATVP